MRSKGKSNSLRLALRLVVGLTTGIFVLSVSVILNAGGFHSHKGWKWKGASPNCGDTITTYTSLFTDLDCSGYSGGAALTLGEGAELNMNGKMVIGNTGINCIEMTGGATLRNGTVVNCKEGIQVEGSRNQLISIESSNNDRRGFRIRNGNKNVLYKCLADGNGRKGFSIEETDHNLLVKCSAINNGQQGFSIEGEGAHHNKLYSSEATANCRDGIEIDEGKGNSVVNNLVEDNGNPETCEEKGEDYKPWFYAGIDVTNNSNNNEIKYNSACGNLGCVACYDELGEPTCKARERNFWDENVSDIGDSVSTNVWENNRVFCKNVMPEFSPGP